MTEIKTSDGQSYLIPIESLDFTHLSKYMRNTNAERTPLWSNSYLNGESEYYEVKIVSQDVHNKCYSEPSVTYECHICNINVPITCSKEHNNSNIHNTYKNIFDKVLERLSKQINFTSVTFSDNTLDQHMYFCKICSKIVKTENRIKHESSTHHTKAQENVNVVNEFYKIFNDVIDNDSDDSVDDCDVDSYISYEDFDETVSEADCTNETLTTADIIIPNVYKTAEDVPDTTANAVAGNQIKVKNESFEDYLKDMVKKYNLQVTLPAVDGNNVTIKAPNGDKITVKSEEFHSYSQLKNSIYCQMCKMWISQETQAHDRSEKHVRNIFKPISNQFARVIDTLSSHCIPCNEVMLTDSVHHGLNDNHKLIFKNVITNATKNNTMLAWKKTLCGACNVYIDTHNFTGHTYSKKHINNLMQQNSIKATDTNDFICNLCNVNLTKANIVSHVNGNNHIAKKNNKQIVVTNNNNKPTVANNTKTNDDSNSQFCEICKRKVPKGGMQTHINGKPHIAMVSMLNAATKGSSSTDKYVPTTPVPLNVPLNNADSVSTDSREYDYASSTDSDARIDGYYDQTEFIDDTRKKVKCKICNVPFDFIERIIIEHMEGRKHLDQVNKNKEEQERKKRVEGYYKFLGLDNAESQARAIVTCKICNINLLNVETIIVQHMEGKQHLDKQKLDRQKIFLVKKEDDNTIATCELCDVFVPNMDRNIKEHIEGRIHVENENALLLFHKIQQLETEYFCKCCDVKIIDYVEHINSREHTLKYQRNYPIDKDALRKYVYNDTLKGAEGNRYRECYKNLLKHNRIYELNNKYFCTVCAITLTRISEIDHVLGERHRLRGQERGML